MEKRNVTLQEVARKAGVSKATASAVLSGNHPHVRVSEDTRRRILEAVRELDYNPNAIARSLLGGKTNTLGFYRHDTLLSGFHAEIVAGLQAGCLEARRDLLLYGAFQGKTTAETYAGLVDCRADGLAILLFPDDPLIELLRESRLPVVAVADAVPGIPSVTADDVLGGTMTAAHLHERGHRNVLYFARVRPPVSCERRYRAFVAEAERRGLRVITQAVNDLTPPDWGIPDWRSDEIRRLFSGPERDRPTAVVCWSDVGAGGVLRQCERYGLRIPEDLALVGFDGVAIDGTRIANLTTIRAPWGDVARTAIRLLVRRIEGEIIPEETPLPVTLLQGTTT
ncbi:MAG: LacI family DNA-binding transcriptional regulator [Capsulimonadales bacterium]|nr:LacI family DNA-binding transcriptional regulator [Capsulimonadales bacterium]